MFFGKFKPNLPWNCSQKIQWIIQQQKKITTNVSAKKASNPNSCVICNWNSTDFLFASIDPNQLFSSWFSYLIFCASEAWIIMGLIDWSTSVSRVNKSSKLRSFLTASKNKLIHRSIAQSNFENWKKKPKNCGSSKNSLKIPSIPIRQMEISIYKSSIIRKHRKLTNKQNKTKRGSQTHLKEISILFFPENKNWIRNSIKKTFLGKIDNFFWQIKFSLLNSVKSQIWTEPKCGQLQFKPIYQNSIPKITWRLAARTIKLHFETYLKC
jgi:hypothetical protein